MRFAITERGTYERCKRQAVLTSKNGDHLTVFFGPIYMSVGTLVHRSHQLWMDAWYKRNDRERTLYEYCLDASVEETDKVRERYKKQVGVYPKESQLDTLHESIDFALAMCENFQVKYGQPLPDSYRFFATEQKIEWAVPGTEHTCYKCGSVRFSPSTFPEACIAEACIACDECYWIDQRVSLHYLEGRVDALLQHVNTGRIDPLERKTYNSRPNEQALKHNDQFLGYDALVRSIGFNTDLGSCTFYDGQWRRKEIPRGKTFDDLFMRVVLPERPKHERDEFVKFLPRQLSEMYDLYRAYAQDRSTPIARTHRMWRGCGDCKMEELCDAMSTGKGTQVLLTEKYTTREDDVTEQETAE